MRRDKARKVGGALGQLPAHGEAEIGKSEHHQVGKGKPAERNVVAVSQKAVEQPPLFENSIPQSVSIARGADVEADIRTFKGKYAAAYESFRGLTQEIRKACEKKKPS